MKISADAHVNKKAQLGANVKIGPGSVIEEDVVIGDNCEIKSNVVIARGTCMGPDNRVFSNCVLGEEPQISGQKNSPTQLIIGSGNTFREMVTISRGSPRGGGKTVIGDNNYFMIGVHFGHDVVVENNTTIGNYVQIAGHCKLENNVWLSAFTGAHQFVTIGQYAYSGGSAGITHDIPPFVKIAGSYPCQVRGLNVTGLTRAGFSEQSIKALKKAYLELYSRRAARNIAQTVEYLAAQSDIDEKVLLLLQALQRSFQHRMGRHLEQFRH